MQFTRTLRAEDPKAGAHTGHARERSGQRKHIAGVCRLQRDAAEQTLDIENAVKRAAQLLAGDGIGGGGFHGVEAQIDFRGVERGPQHPGAE